MQQATFGKKGAGNEDIAAKRAAFQTAERQRMMGGASQAAPQPRANLAQPTLQTANSGYAPSAVTPEQARAALGMAQAPQQKSLMLAYVLWFFACSVSAHRFYLGAIQSAFVQAGFYLGGFLIMIISSLSKTFGSMFYLGTFFVLIGAGWMLIDAFLIPGLRDRMAHRSNQRNYNGIFA